MCRIINGTPNFRPRAIMRFLLFLTILLFSNYAKSQNSYSKVQEALTLISQGEIEDAFNQLQKLASTNNLIAQYYIAQCYEIGLGTEKNTTKAFQMYRKSAERGLPEGMKDLARCYQKGIGVDKNQEKAYQWQRRFEAKQTKGELINLLRIYNEFLDNNSLVAKKDNIVTNFQNDNILNTNETVNNLQTNRKIQSSNSPQPIITSNESVTNISDVDVNIPFNNVVKVNTFAIIIANENYKNVDQVPHSLNDGTVFAQYCKKTLGIPSENIKLTTDATFGEMRGVLSWMHDIAQAYKGDLSFIFYYSGHGIPDEKTREGYLVPIDGNPKDLITCLSLEELYNKFSELPSNKVITLIDACFSGAQRGKGMLVSARGIALKHNKKEPKGKVLALTSSQGDETAYPYDEQNHGLFTYYLLKYLQENKGEVLLGDLVEYIKDNVVKKSIKVNGKPQTPSMIPSSTIINEWKNWTLN